MYYNIDTLPYDDIKNIPFQVRSKGNQKTKERVKYKDIIVTFDIESSRLPDDSDAFMYIRQLQLGPYTVIGRYWDEYITLIEKLTYYLNKNEYIVIYVHNLSYEFQFLSGIFDFNTKDVFCMDRRKILKARSGNIEYRCSYLYSNLSLDQFTKAMGVEHLKLSGDEFNYNKLRWPWTELTKDELDYAINDVKGLQEALIKSLELYNDNLYTVPLTSTGIVRRDGRRVMRSWNNTTLKSLLPDYEEVLLLRRAFRGGDVHANRYYTELVIYSKDYGLIHGADINSSYPNAQVNYLYPMTPFKEVPKATIDDVIDLITKRERALLMEVAFIGLRLSNDKWGFPYLSTAKCEGIINGYYDNGRILACSYLETVITDIDLEIILKEYTFNDIVINKCYSSRYGKLPKPLIDLTLEYYHKKTTLKGVKGQEQVYQSYKARLNSIYGMSVTSPIKATISYHNGNYYIEDCNEEELLTKNNKKAFQAYQRGIWTTAIARKNLHDALHYVVDQGATPIYVDTDSIKYIGEVDWASFNKKIRATSKKNNAYAIDVKGVTHYLGEWEQEDNMLEWCSLGSKKYVYRSVEDNKLHITISGVHKIKGAEELEAKGGIEAFKDGFTFYKGGGSESVYNDDSDYYLTIDGHKLHITKNVLIKDSTYTLGITEEYKRLLEDPVLYKELTNML